MMHGPLNVKLKVSLCTCQCPHDIGQ